MKIALTLEDGEQEINIGDTIVFREGEFKGNWLLTEISEDLLQLTFVDNSRQMMIYRDERMPIVIV